MAKCEVISEAKAFKPVTLQITLESQEEVNALHYIVAYACMTNSKTSGHYRVAGAILGKVREYAD